MKTKTLRILIAIFFVAVVYHLSLYQVSAQAPQKINYQAIVRDTSGNILKNQSVSFLIKIIDSLPAGTDIYHETHDALTNQYGLITLKIGNGNNPSTSFSSINWASGDKYLEIQLDANGPSGGYTWYNFGTTQLVSVPYALYAEKASTLCVAGTSGQTLRHNGTTWLANSILYNNGINIGIGTTSPTALLHTKGNGTGEGNVLFTGEYKISSPGVAPVEGSGTRMMWYPDKAAFRAGSVNGPRWDTDSIGNFSVAWGYNTKANGNYSVASGRLTTASGESSTAIGSVASAYGNYSVAIGNVVVASGNSSIALGLMTNASGLSSTASGYQTNASGAYSFAGGGNTDALSGYETVLGRFNTTYIPVSTNGWDVSDRLFEIGNGISSAARSNAITVLKNGNTGMGTDVPAALLHTYGTNTGGGNVLFEGTYKSSNPGTVPVSGAGTRMMWYPDKAAFRAGYVNGTQWDKDSIGNYSVALGYCTKSKGPNALAFGRLTIASGDNSTAAGSASKASGNYSTALGNTTTASGNSSTSLGLLTTASGLSSIAMGNYSVASGSYSTAMGANTTASGNNSTAMGKSTTASGLNSTSIGGNTMALGHSSAAMGNHTVSYSYSETVIGRYNKAYTPSGQASWVESDRLFVIGNGADSTSTSNAMTVLKNGNTGIGTETPVALLHTYGIEVGEGNVVFEGDIKLSGAGSAPLEGEGTRMMWYPNKGAFRAGTVSSTQWDSDSIGLNSFACGLNAKAAGNYSFASGNETNALDYYCTAMGKETVAYGFYSTALGNSTIAYSSAETVIGSLNTTYVPSGVSGWNENDRLFVIGNGSGIFRSNALTVLKNGCFGFQTVTSPTYALELPNHSSVSTGHGRAYAWDTYSDARLKSNIDVIPYGLNEVLKLQPIKYFHHNSIIENRKIIIDDKGSINIGFLAQDVYKVIPEVVNMPKDESSELWSMNYEKLTPVLVKAIQEQQMLIESQQKQIQELKIMVEGLIKK